MIKNIYILSLLLLLAACSSNEYVGETIPNERPITLGGNAGMVTRTGSSQGLEDVLPADNKTALIYGIKNTAASAPVQWEDVFQNYVLSYTAGSAGTTASNSNGWEYVGETSLGVPPVTQTIKYWDYSAEPYIFFSVAPSQSTGITKSSDGMVYTAENITASSILYYTRPQFVEKEYYRAPVTLNFYNVLSKVRVGVYETIPGYAITDIKFHTSLDGGELKSSPVLICTDTEKKFADQGRYTITAKSNSEVTVVLEAEDGHKKADFVAGTETAIPHVTGVTLGDSSSPNTLGTASNNPSFGKTSSGNGYVYALSTENVSRQLAIKCDYTLKSLSQGSNEVIEIKNQTAYIPAQYGTWRPNYAYTYLFKITEAGAGLYPISFDACIETFADNGDGTVTIVQKPSITTWQYEAVHDGDVNTPENDVHYVVAPSTSDVMYDVDVQVSTTDVTNIANTGRALEVCYYGPQITEGEFELLDKKAMADDNSGNAIKNFVWAPIAAMSGGSLTPSSFGYRKSETEVVEASTVTALMNCNESADSHYTTTHGTHPTYNNGSYTFGTFRPLRGGYYAIRFTYTVGTDPTPLYAYKIVKIGDYFYLRPTINIDDTYQNGVVIE